MTSLSLLRVSAIVFAFSVACSSSEQGGSPASGGSGGAPAGGSTSPGGAGTSATSGTGGTSGATGGSSASGTGGGSAGTPTSGGGSSGTAGEENAAGAGYEAECVAAASTECERCVCSNCTDELMACASTEGCDVIVACIRESGCTGVDCYCGTFDALSCSTGKANGPCKSAILAAPGGHEPSALNPSAGPASDAAIAIGNCAQPGRPCEKPCAM